MNKWYGKVGYAVTVETEPGIWEEHITERNYYGDVINNFRRKLQNSGGVNDNITLSNAISIISDPFATQNYCNIRYVEYLGSKWKVTDVEVSFPRLNLTVGGLYNG